MSVVTEINRIKTNIANTYASAEAKGATTPAIKNSDNLKATVDSIPAGGGSIDEYLGGSVLSTNDRYPYIIKLPVIDCSKLKASYVPVLFENFTNLKEIEGLILNPKITSIDYLFQGCTSLVVAPNIDVANIGNFRGMFFNCSSLKNIPLLDFSKANNIYDMFYGCPNLQNLGGFKNLGKAYTKTEGENYELMMLKLYGSSNLTHDSLMNVINNLYDLKSIGVPPQMLVLGSNNLAKLTPEEIAVATNKGWNVQ